MPKPNKGESKQDYISRCIPIVKGEGKTQDQAAGQCYGMWNTYKNKKKSFNICKYKTASIKGVRLTVNGVGLLNNNVLDRSQLTDDEEFELIDELDFGLTQPPRGLDTSSIFYFTPEGLESHSRLIELLEKAAKGNVDYEYVDIDENDVIWDSGDGQLAVRKTAFNANKYKVAFGWDDAGHLLLDVLGFVPGAGEVADAINAIWYAGEGEWLYAGFSVLSLVPTVGDAIGKGGKLTVWISKTFPKYGDDIIRIAPEVGEAARTLITKIDELKPLVQQGLPQAEQIMNKFVENGIIEEGQKNSIIGELNKFVSHQFDETHVQSVEQEQQGNVADVSQQNNVNQEMPIAASNSSWYKISVITEPYDLDNLKDELKEAVINAIETSDFGSRNEIKETIKQAFELIDLTEINSESDWNALLSSLGGFGIGINQYYFRDVFTALFSWSIPTKEVLDNMVEFAGGATIKDLLGGSGYWAYLLNKAGGKVEAFEISNPEGEGVEWTKGTNRKNFFNMNEKDIRQQVINPNDVIFMSWVPYESDMANGILHQMVPGQKLIVIGEGYGGCTADDCFHEILSRDFEEVEGDFAYLTRFSGLNDEVSYYIKKGNTTASDLQTRKLAALPLDKSIRDMDDLEFEAWLLNNMDNNETFCGDTVEYWKRSKQKMPQYCLDLMKKMLLDEMEVQSNSGNNMFKYSQTEDGGKVYDADLGIDIPYTLKDVLMALKQHGAYGLLVGGAVRDKFLGMEPKDLDVEVYNTNYENLLKFLTPFDRKNNPDVVGKSFGIIKITDREGNEYDFSIPRRESKTGIGHQGFDVEFDPDITPKEAAARRDFTMNALAYDPLDHKVYDYFDGVEDIQNKVLKATSPAFAEDPLRVLRGMQFAGRFGFSLDDETAEMTRTLIEEYPSLAKERVSGEWMKFFTKSKHPGKALEFLVKSGWIKLYPEIDAFIPDEYEEELLGDFVDPNYPGIHGRREIRQEQEWHPEGGVMTHTIYVLEAAAKIADEKGLAGDDRAVLLMAALCHDFGKADYTQIEEKKGVPRVTSPGHEGAGVPITERFLESIGIKRDLIQRVSPLVGSHMQHIDYNPKSRGGNVRQIAERIFPATIRELEMVIRSDMGGRPPLPGGLPPEAEQMVSDALEHGVYEGKYQDFIQGRDLISEFNVKPGPVMGETLKYVREQALRGAVNNREEALMAADNFLKNKNLYINGKDVMLAMGVTKGGPFIREILDAAWAAQKSQEFSDRDGALNWLNNYVGKPEEESEEINETVPEEQL